MGVIIAGFRWVNSGSFYWKKAVFRGKKLYMCENSFTIVYTFDIAPVPLILRRNR